MKKTLTLVAALLAIASQAASIDWSMTGTAAVNGSNGDPLSGATLYLISANDTSWTTKEYNSKQAFLAALAEVTINDTYALDNDGKKPTIENVVVTSDLMGTTSMTFGLMVLEQTSTGGYNFKLTTVTATPYATGATADAHTVLKTNISKLASGTSAPWTAASVPEPSTAALALAGLALLLKRRKA